MLEEAREVWVLWNRVCTQWRVGMDVVGLDYPAVFAVAEVYGQKVTPEILEGLQVLERDYLKERAEEWQERRK